MKRVRCPKCDNYITFDETKYSAGQSLVFKCDQCGKEFGIRIGVSKLRNTQKEESKELDALTSNSISLGDGQGEVSPLASNCGMIIVIENVFHYKPSKSFHCAWATTS